MGVCLFKLVNLKKVGLKLNVVLFSLRQKLSSIGERPGHGRSKTLKFDRLLIKLTSLLHFINSLD